MVTLLMYKQFVIGHRYVIQVGDFANACEVKNC